MKRAAAVLFFTLMSIFFILPTLLCIRALSISSNGVPRASIRSRFDLNNVSAGMWGGGGGETRGTSLKSGGETRMRLFRPNRSKYRLLISQYTVRRHRAPGAEDWCSEVCRWG